MSAEFAAGSRACLKLSPEGTDAHDQLLATLEIRWTACRLRSVLCAEIAGQRINLAGSEVHVSAFSEGNVLWLQSGLLESSEHQLFDQVAMKLFWMLEGTNVPVPHHGHYPCMFACYKKGPTAIEAALKQRNVKPQATVVGQKREPGKALDVIDHELLQQSTDFTFDEGELIAVSSAANKDGVPQYHYACVLPYVEGASRGPSGLLAMYRLNEGPDAPEKHRNHFELFKLQRAQPLPPLAAQLGMTLDCAALDASHAVATGAIDAKPDSESAELACLVAKLREMERMTPDQYRQVMKRLWLEWHPDKNPHREAMATRFFRIIKRHEESFRGDRDFSWLSVEAAGEALKADERAEATAASATSCSYPRPRSWANEFEEEERATKSAIKLQEDRQRTLRAAARLWKCPEPPIAVSRETNHPFAVSSSREKNNAKADQLWQVADTWLTAARVLLDGCTENGMACLYPQVVHSSQQAGEMVIKSLMFRTCGITQEELRGKQAHDLQHFISIIYQTETWDCPVPANELSFLTEAYIASRYPLGDMQQTPRDKYGPLEAEYALSTATRLRDWATLIHSLPTPLH
jgi:HEPN domain-containing protein